MIFTYSPNWYKPQCLHFNHNNLYYCSNYILYEYDLQLKSVQSEVCFRQLAMTYNLNHKDIKICSITSNHNKIFVGINQPFLFQLHKDSLEVVQVTALKGFETVEYIHLYKNKEKDMAILCNKDGSMLKYSIDQQQDKLQKLQYKHKSSGVKAIYQIDQHHCAIFTRGTIMVYNSDFSKLDKVIEVSHNDTIFSVDCLQQDNRAFFCFLTKNKDSQTVTVFEFKIQEEFPLQKKKKIEEIGINIHQFYVHLYYPKQFSQKLKAVTKASLTLKFLSPNKLLFTGKFGEIASLNTQNIKLGSNVIIRPYSNNQQNKEYEMWPDSKHYKEIYFIYKHLQRLYIISTDHNLSVWLIKQNAVKYIYSLKFLTASIQSFFFAENDPRTLFALLKDSAVRSFAPLEEGAHQLNEYWKFSKKYKIKKAICHPFEPGVLGLVTECRRIQLYDIYEDRLMKLIQIGEQILNISFEFPLVHRELEGLFKCEFKEQKYNCLSLGEKEMQGKTVLLVQSQKSLIIIEKLSEKQICCWRSQKEKRIERIHDNRYWDRRMLLATQNKNNVLSLFVRMQEKNISQFEIALKYQQGRTLFKSEQHSNEIIVINFKGTKFSMFRVGIKLQAGICELLFSCQICLQHPIDYLHINYNDWRIAVYNQREDCISVIHLNRLVHQKYEITKSCDVAQLLAIQAKLEVLMFYLEQYMVMATKDQSIKVLKLSELEEWKKGGKKKGMVVQINEIEEHEK